MQIAIVIPVFNRKELALRCADSVAAQTYRPLRLILVDNNSSDGSLQAMRQWAAEHQTADFRVDVVSEPKPGAPAARNAGLRLVEEEWTMFFDSDDTMAPEHVARAMQCAAERPGAGIVGWDVENIGLDGKTRTLPFAYSDLIFHAVQHGTMATQRYMARTELFRRAGGWNEDVRVWNDIELGVRLLRLFETGNADGLNIFKVNGKPTVKVYSQAVSISGTDYSTNGAEREHAIDCIEATLDPKSRWIANLKRAVLAGLYAREGHSAQAAALRKKIVGANRWQAFIFSIGYRITAASMPGAAALLRPLL